MYHLLLLFLPPVLASPDLPRISRSMLEDDPCLDANQVSEIRNVAFSSRYKHLKRPWMRNDISPKIYTSPGLQYQWSWVESLPIRGLTPSTTVGDVIRWMDDTNCSFLATGKAVWQTILRSKPTTISGETNCPLNQLYHWCNHRFGATSCGLYPVEEGGWGAYRLDIGDARANSSIEELRAEPLRLFEWGAITGQKVEEWPFSVDSMAIHDNQAGQMYLIDLSGRGYHDVCEKRISSAVDEEKWKKWSNGSIDKMLQFYQLRWLGFSAANTGLEKYINQKIEEKYSKKDVQTFYCETLLGGVVNWAGDDLTTACHVVYPEPGDVKKIASAREILSHELGPSLSSKFQAAIDEMEAVYLTARQFEDVKDRLKHRISSPPHAHSDPHLVLGQPLVNDISEVHRRPILSKSEVNGELPKDFPSGPKAQPDGNGVFREQGHPLSESDDEMEPEGAGGGFQDPDDTKNSEEEDEETEGGAYEDGEEDVKNTEPPSQQQQQSSNRYFSVPLAIFLCLL